MKDYCRNRRSYALFSLSDSSL